VQGDVHDARSMMPCHSMRGWCMAFVVVLGSIGSTVE